MGAPASLKDNVLAAYRADVAPELVPEPAPQPAPVVRAGRCDRAAARRWQAPNWMGWAAAAVALVLLAVLSVYGLNLRQQADQANQRADQIAAGRRGNDRAGVAGCDPARSGAAAGVTGFAAFPTTGDGYMVMTDVPAAPSGMTYQAWYIVDGKPSSAGTMAPTSDGNVIAAGLTPSAGTSVVAVTLEPAGGSDQPTSHPIIVGDVTTAT